MSPRSASLPHRACTTSEEGAALFTRSSIRAGSTTAPPGDGVPGLDAVADAYADLLRIAAYHLRGERSGHALAAPDLVGEAVVRLMTSELLGSSTLAQIRMWMSCAMRRILIDHARRRLADKRGAGAPEVELDELPIAMEQSSEVDEVRAALAALARADARKARVVWLRYFGGLSLDEIARACLVHVNTAARDLRQAEAWLRAWLRTG